MKISKINKAAANKVAGTSPAVVTQAVKMGGNVQGGITTLLALVLVTIIARTMESNYL